MNKNNNNSAKLNFLYKAVISLFPHTWPFPLTKVTKKTAEFPRIEEKQRSEKKKKKQRRQQEKQQKQQQRVCVNALEETRRCGRTYQKRAEQSLPKRAEQHKFH